MGKTSNEILREIDKSIPGYKVFYVEDTGNQTYEEGTDWDAVKKPEFFDINNNGAANLTIEINEDGNPYTVSSGSALGAISEFPYISKIEILATDTFVLLVRK